MLQTSTLRLPSGTAQFRMTSICAQFAVVPKAHFGNESIWTDNRHVGM
ncbi:MAG: hypothetical protein JWP08_2877 [Bryobacterales bacterium]|nr:hypothetical protein [Bryobacterales bacterium]